MGVCAGPAGDGMRAVDRQNSRAAHIRGREFVYSRSLENKRDAAEVVQPDGSIRYYMRDDDDRMAFRDPAKDPVRLSGCCADIVEDHRCRLCGVAS